MHLKLFTCLGLLSAVLVGCSSATAKNRNKVPYPTESKQAFINGCVQSAPKALCECAFKKVQGQYTFEEFKQAELQMQQTGKAPADFLDIIQSCKQ